MKTTAFVPAFHIQCRRPVSPVTDDLPHFASLPPAFRGTPEQVDW